MKVKVLVNRTFTSGFLAGITLRDYFIFTGDSSNAPIVGSEYEVTKPIGGSPYRDIIVAWLPVPSVGDNPRHSHAQAI